MKLNPFKKTKDGKREQAKQELDTLEQGEVVREKLEERMGGSQAFSGVSSTEAHKILRGFYVSEKASMGAADNQYMFKVFQKANKSEIKKEVSRLFNVKVKNVKMLNMPEKRRDFGRHPGTKPGFKKAIVVLEKGYVIGQAKP